jgi:hypothetical protein
LRCLFIKSFSFFFFNIKFFLLILKFVTIDGGFFSVFSFLDSFSRFAETPVHPWLRRNKKVMSTKMLKTFCVFNAFAQTSSLSLHRKLLPFPNQLNRRDVLSVLSTMATLPILPSSSHSEEPPLDWGLRGEGYSAESLKLIKHMRYCVGLEKGTPNMGTEPPFSI